MNVEATFDSACNTKVVTFTQKTRTRAHESFLPDRISSSNGPSVYELRSVTIKEGNTVKTVVRYGGRYGCWWLYSSCVKVPGKIDVDDNALLTQFHNNWISCHYEMIDSLDLQEERCQYLEYLRGQGRFVCEKHNIPLTVSRQKTNTTCSFNSSCRRKAAWQCPSDECQSAACRTHFNINSLNDNRIQVRAPSAAASVLLSSTNEECDEDDYLSEPESEEDPFSFTNFVTDAGNTESTNFSATDAGDNAVEMDNVIQTKPTHVLFNTDCHILQRKQLRNERRKTSSQFLQNIVASTPGDSIPFVYPDASLFPTLFYHEQNDGTMTGALPAPLFGDKKSETFTFANIEDHKRSSVLNPNLL